MRHNVSPPILIDTLGEITETGNKNNNEGTGKYISVK